MTSLKWAQPAAVGSDSNLVSSYVKIHLFCQVETEILREHISWRELENDAGLGWF